MLEQQQQLESIDHIHTEGMLHAEKKCRKLAMGQVEWSPEIALARQRKLLWQKVVRKKCGGWVSSSYIKQKARQCGVICPLSYTLPQAIGLKDLAI